jgi:hypothetical protein
MRIVHSRKPLALGSPSRAFALTRATISSTLRQRNTHDKRGGKSEREESIDAEASHSGRPEPRKSRRITPALTINGNLSLREAALMPGLRE